MAFSRVRRKSGRIRGLGRSFEGSFLRWGSPGLGTAARGSRLLPARKRAVRIERGVGKRGELFRTITGGDAGHGDGARLVRERDAKVLQRQHGTVFGSTD